MLFKTVTFTGPMEASAVSCLVLYGDICSFSHYGDLPRTPRCQCHGRPQEIFQGGAKYFIVGVKIHGTGSRGLTKVLKAKSELLQMPIF